MATRPPRSLAEALRARADADLASLFAARPDLVAPLPSDLAGVAARATTRASVHRALAGLDLPTLQVATALIALPAPVSLGQVAAACRASTARVRPLVQRLFDLALAFGSTRAAHPVRALQEVLGPHPAGLGPDLADLLVTSPARLASACSALGLPSDVSALSAELRNNATDLMQDAPPESRDLLATLDHSGPVGSVRNAGRATDPVDRSPLGWLLARALVVPVDDEHVVVPREVGLNLRGGVLTLAEPPTHPVADDTRWTPAAIDRAASGTVAEVVRQVTELVTELDARPAPVLRNGGVAAREVTRLGRHLHLDAGTTAVLLVLAAGAHLIAVDEDVDPQLRPTEVCDAWLADSTGTRWVALVRGWLDAPWAPTLVGTRDARGALCNALSPTTERDAERRLRTDILQILASAPTIAQLSADTITDFLRFHAPRGPVAAAARLVPTVLGEAHRLGLLAFDRVPTPVHSLATNPSAAAAALDEQLPPPVDRVLVQADLTAVAPGRLTHATQSLLDLAADVESRGAATVFRFSGSSIERALDAGRDADTLLADLARIAVGDLPQPLEYLVTDTARRHGQLRVGGAGSYLRSDDPDVLTELLALPRLRGLGWRRLAPTVIAAPTDPGRTQELVRIAGMTAVAEDGDGTLVLAGEAPTRAPVRARFGSRPERPPQRDPEQLAEVIRLLRLADRSAKANPGDAHPPADAGDPDGVLESLQRLRTAVARGEPVWVTFSDASGDPHTILVQPLSVDGGQARVVEMGRGIIRTLPAHRVLSVRA